MGASKAARAEHLLIRDSQNLLDIANTYISVLEQSQQGKPVNEAWSVRISNPYASPKTVLNGNSVCRFH